MTLQTSRRLLLSALLVPLVASALTLPGCGEPAAPTNPVTEADKKEAETIIQKERSTSK